MVRSWQQTSHLKTGDSQLTEIRISISVLSGRTAAPDLPPSTLQSLISVFVSDAGYNIYLKHIKFAKRKLWSDKWMEVRFVLVRKSRMNKNNTMQESWKTGNQMKEVKFVRRSRKSTPFTFDICAYYVCMVVCGRGPQRRNGRVYQKWSMYTGDGQRPAKDHGPTLNNDLVVRSTVLALHRGHDVDNWPARRRRRRITMLIHMCIGTARVGVMIQSIQRLHHVPMRFFHLLFIFTTICCFPTSNSSLLYGHSITMYFEYFFLWT